MAIQRAGGQRPGATYRPPVLRQTNVWGQHYIGQRLGGCRGALSVVAKAAETNEGHSWATSSLRLPRAHWWNFRSRAVWHHYDLGRQPSLSFALSGDTGQRPAHIQLYERVEAAFQSGVETIQAWLEAILDILLTPLRLLVYSIQEVLAALNPFTRHPEQQLTSAVPSTQPGSSAYAQHAQHSITYPIDIDSIRQMRQSHAQPQAAPTSASYRQQLQGAVCSIGEAVQASAPYQLVSTWSPAQQIGASAMVLLLLAGPACLRRWLDDLERSREEQELLEANAFSMNLQKQRFQAALGTVAASTKAAAAGMARSSSLLAASSSHATAEAWDSEDEEEDVPAMLRHTSGRPSTRQTQQSGRAAPSTVQASQRATGSRDGWAVSPTKNDVRLPRGNSNSSSRQSFLDQSAAQEWQQFLSSSKALDVSELWDASSLSDNTSLGAPAASKAQLEEITRRVRNANIGKDGDKPIVTFDDLYGVPLQDKGAPIRSHRILDGSDKAAGSRNSASADSTSQPGRHGDQRDGDQESAAGGNGKLQPWGDRSSHNSSVPNFADETMEERVARRKARFASQFADDADVAAMMGQAPAGSKKSMLGAGGQKATNKPMQRAGSVLPDAARTRSTSIPHQEPQLRARSTTPVLAQSEVDSMGAGRPAEKRLAVHQCTSASNSGTLQVHVQSSSAAGHQASSIDAGSSAGLHREQSPQPATAQPLMQLPRNNVVPLQSGRPAERRCSLQPPLPAARAPASGQIAWDADRGSVVEATSSQPTMTPDASSGPTSPQAASLMSPKTHKTQDSTQQQPQRKEGLEATQSQQLGTGSVLQQASQNDAKQVCVDHPEPAPSHRPLASRLHNSADDFGSRKAGSTAARDSASSEPVVTCSQQQQAAGHGAKLIPVRSPFGGVIMRKATVPPADSTTTASQPAACFSAAEEAAAPTAHLPTALSRAQRALASDSRGAAHDKAAQQQLVKSSAADGHQGEQQDLQMPAQGEHRVALQRFMRRPTSKPPAAADD